MQGNNNNSLEFRLRLTILKLLENCEEEGYPKFCQLTRTKEGYLKAENMIINYVLANDVSVSTAIAMLETEL